MHGAFIATPISFVGKIKTSVVMFMDENRFCSHSVNFTVLGGQKFKTAALVLHKSFRLWRHSFFTKNGVKIFALYNFHKLAIFGAYVLIVPAKVFQLHSTI